MVIIVIPIATTIIIVFQYQGCHCQEKSQGKTNILQGQEKVKGNL